MRKIDELKRDNKRLAAQIQYWKYKCSKLEFVERDNKILRDRVKVLELEHEMI